MELIKFALIFATILAVGVVILPQTISVFWGIHNWYYLDNPRSDVPCQKCHADVYEELNLSTLHKRWGNPNVADTADCEACHVGNASVTYANGTANQPGLEAHAATPGDCTYCHFNRTNMHDVVHGNLSKALNYNANGCRCHTIHGTTQSSLGMAGGFGLSDHDNDTGINSTHFELLVGTAFESSLYPGESEGCIFCHTDISVSFNVTTYTGYAITVQNVISGTASGWSIASVNPSNFTTYREVKQ